jgi:hypothetical protein
MHATAFYRKVADSGIVWSIRDAAGFPAPTAPDGNRAMPFWSSESRARAVIRAIESYRSFEPEPIHWDVFCNKWIPGLVRDGPKAGINWSGEPATGFDVEPEELRRNVEALQGGCPL